MVKFNQITEDYLDVNKPYFKWSSPTKLSWIGRVLNPSKTSPAKGSKPPKAKLIAQSTSPSSTPTDLSDLDKLKRHLRKKEDIYGGIVTLPATNEANTEEDDEEEEYGEEEEEEEEKEEDEEVKEIETTGNAQRHLLQKNPQVPLRSRPVDHTPKKFPPGAGVGDLDEHDLNHAQVQALSPEALQEIQELKQSMAGLQTQMGSLRQANNALRSALCAQAGGSLPVEKLGNPVFAGSRANDSVESLSAPASQPSGKKEAIVSGAQDELDAANAGSMEEQVTHLPEPEVSRLETAGGICPATFLSGCWSSKRVDVHGLEPETSRVKSALSSPLATTAAGTSTIAAASTIAGSPILSPTSTGEITMASPWPAKAPSREPPMASCREQVPGIPSKWQQHSKLEELAHEEHRPGLLRHRPRPLALNSSASSSFGPGKQHGHQLDDEDEESDGPEAPPEGAEGGRTPCRRPPSPPSPPLAPEFSWTPGVGQSWQASPRPTNTRTVKLPFPDVPMDHRLELRHAS